MRPRLVAFVRSAPATYTYLAILFVTTWLLASASARLADRLLLAESTNLHHLARDPIRVLIGSAFWLSGTRDLIIAACVFTVVLAPVERRIGAWRTAGVFAIGHVGATLLTAAGLWAALRFDSRQRSQPPDRHRIVSPNARLEVGFRMLADEVDYVVGVDPHRDSHALAVVHVVSGAVLFEAAVEASSDGYAHALKLVDQHAAGRRVFAVEGAGSFGAGLTRFLGALWGAETRVRLARRADVQAEPNFGAPDAS